MSCTEVRSCDRRGYVLKEGKETRVPHDWMFVKSGDAALTRRIKAKTDCFRVMKDGRKKRVQAVGLFAARSVVEKIQKDLETERSQPEYQRRLDSSRRYREKKESEYVGDFEESIFQFLHFTPSHHALAREMSTLIAEHATPVGSGTVARTKLLPLEQRAELATWAWLRHAITDYDHMKIPNKKGVRRQVRHKLKLQNRRILECYRSSGRTPPSNCPLRVYMKRRETMSKEATNSDSESEKSESEEPSSQPNKNFSLPLSLPDSEDFVDLCSSGSDNESSVACIDLVESDSENVSSPPRKRAKRRY